jgi:predicted DNA-binding protein (MmcQ/YjbR family)
VETFPFGEEVRVYKVCNKIFGLHPVETTVKISLKCEPMLAEILRGTVCVRGLKQNQTNN